jgi:hypothetical protein
MGLGKPSSPVTTLSNCSCPPSRWFSGGRMRHQYDGRGGQLLGVKTSTWEQSPDFDLVRTSWMVVVHETCGAMCTMCSSGSSPAGRTPIRIAMTLSDMSYCLLLLSSRSMSCCTRWMVQRMVMVMFIMMITVLLYL